MYTDIVKRGNNLLVREVVNGKDRIKSVEFKPTLYITGAPSKDIDTDWKTMTGQKVYSLSPGSMNDARETTEQYRGISGMEIFSSPSFVHEYISDTWPEEIKWDSSDLRINAVDIETTTELGFPQVTDPQEEVTLITIYDSIEDHYYTWASRPTKFKKDNATIIQCKNEKELLLAFLDRWKSKTPHVITGWNIRFFDMPYLFARITAIFGLSVAKSLSPMGYVSTKEVELFGKSQMMISIAGVSELDYLELYKKFCLTNRDSYSLDNIAFVELGLRKLDMPGDTFKENYTEHWDMFVEYNIIDVELIVKLDKKLKYLDAAFVIAYDAKILHRDVFSPVKMWDVIIYNNLKADKIVIPNSKYNEKSEGFAGGFVKTPLVGKHKNVVTLDLDSLYPHIMMQYNMSPEMLTSYRYDVTVQELLDQTFDTSELITQNLSMAGNGCCFLKDEQGLLPRLMDQYYSRRKEYKRMMLEAKQKYEDTGEQRYEYEVARYKNLQLAVKVAINSAYGAFGNKFFRYYDERIAEGITLSGQLAVKWVAERLNLYLNQTINGAAGLTGFKDRVVLIDTDSVALSLEDMFERVPKLKKLGTIEQINAMDDFTERFLKPQVDKAYEDLAKYMNAFDNRMSMKRENLVDVMIAVAKKRYIMSVYDSEGVRYSSPDYKIMGVEIVKSSTPPWVRQALKDCIPIMMQQDESSLHEYVIKQKQEFFKLPMEDVSFPRGITDMNKYVPTGVGEIYPKGTPGHVRAAIMHNHWLKKLGVADQYPLIQSGDKIKFCYLTMPNTVGSNIIGFVNKPPRILKEKLDIERFIDYNTMFDKAFLSPLQGIVGALNWTTEPVSTLDDMFEW